MPGSKFSKHKALVAASSFALMAAAASVARAQDSEATALEEIAVYGAKDVTRLLDSSASVGVVTADQIESGQIRSFRDAFRQLGNVMDADWSDAGFLIRGVNSEGFVPGGSPLATMYVDGIQQGVNATRRGARGLWDVEQVEVYRGPQSTLSGRAALAGAIYIKTKDPTFEPGAAISGTVGNRGLAGTALMLNAPIVKDQVAVRFAGEFQRRKSDINYPTYKQFDRYDDLREDEYMNFRTKVLITPDALPDTKALLTYAYAADRPWTRDIAGPALGFDLGDDRGDFNDPTFAEVRRNKVHNLGAEITHDFSDALKLTSISTANLSDQDRPSVNQGTAGEFNGTAGWMKQNYWTQEVRLNYAKDQWSWVAGVYGSYEKDRAAFDRTSFFSRTDIGRSRITTKNLAAFGEATYEFIPTWKVTAGGRVDKTWQENSQLTQRTLIPSGVVSSFRAYTGKTDDLNFVPKISLSKALTEKQTVGVTFSQGFRTGGTGLNLSTTEIYAYKPEKADNYELFYKGAFLDDRLKINANVFYTKYRNQQIETINPLDGLDTEVVNAGSSESYGFEFEPSFQVTKEFSAFMSVGYVHTKFLSFDEDATFAAYEGRAFPEAPKWTVALGGKYAFDNGFHIGGDVKFTSSYLARFGSFDPIDKLKSRAIANLQAGYKWDRFEATLFVENLFNKRYYTYRDRADFGAGAQDTANTLGERRLVGVNLKATF